MKTELKKLFQKIDGTLLCVGLYDNELISFLEKNKTVTEMFILNENQNKYDGNGEERRLSHVSIYDIKKKFRKKSFDFIINSMEEVKPYLRSFIPNTLKLGKQFIYFYGNIDIFDIDVLKKRYLRYGANVDIKINKNEFFMEIDVRNVRIHFFQNIFYRICDVCTDTIEYISNLFLS